AATASARAGCCRSTAGPAAPSASSAAERPARCGGARTRPRQTHPRRERPGPTNRTPAMQTSMRQDLQGLLTRADIRIGGGRPWDIEVHDDRLYQRVLAGGTLAMGESYMDGWWDCAALDACVHRLRSAHLEEAVSTRRMAWLALKARVLNLQSRRRAYEVGRRHYDLGNDLFERMLGRQMVYSCAYWRGAETLDEAQEAKLDLICRKIGLGEGDHVLDIGCGWGG